MKNYFQKIVELFTGSDLPKSAQDEFYGWLVDEEHASEKDKALQELWTQAHTKPSEETWQALDRMRKSTGVSPIHRKTRPIRIWQSVAAVLLILSASSIYIAFQSSKMESDLIQQYIPTAEVQTLTLPDGTQVQLNSQSTLLYPQTFTGRTRSVFLMGEANFKVTHDPNHPFIVKSNDFQVTALGTEFNVSAYPESPVVMATLISGSVCVEYNNLKSNTILHPNEQLAYNRSTRTDSLSQPDMNDVTAWQRGELVIREMALKDIITILERKYPYTFVYSLGHLKTDNFSFRFKDKASLSEVMDIIINVVGHMRYKIEEDKCYLIPK